MYTLPDNTVITFTLSISNRVIWRGFACGNASLREVIHYFLGQKWGPTVRVDIIGCTTKYKHVVEALHDGSRCGVWQGRANGKREYSSTIVSMYVFWNDDLRGALKYMLHRCMGWVSLMSALCVEGDKNCGFSSAQILHEWHNFLTSSVEYGRFFVRTKCSRRVTPGWHNISWYQKALIKSWS